MAAEERFSNIRAWPLSYLHLVIAIAGALAAANDKKGDAARASSSISFPVSVSFDTQSAAMEQRRSQFLFQLPNFSRLERHARRFNELAIAFSLRCSKLLRPAASQTSTPPLAEPRAGEASHIDEAVANCDGDGIGPVDGADFANGRMNVRVDRSFGDVEDFSDFPGRLTAGHPL